MTLGKTCLRRGGLGLNKTAGSTVDVPRLRSRGCYGSLGHRASDRGRATLFSHNFCVPLLGRCLATFLIRKTQTEKKPPLPVPLRNTGWLGSKPAIPSIADVWKEDLTVPTALPQPTYLTLDFSAENKPLRLLQLLGYSPQGAEANPHTAHSSPGGGKTSLLYMLANKDPELLFLLKESIPLTVTFNGCMPLIPPEADLHPY